MLVTHDLDEAVRLADRIAMLSEGGVLEQYATPAELLGKPANAFVVEFVGADRSIKRLQVTDIDPKRLRAASTVDNAAAGPSVPRRRRRCGTRWPRCSTADAAGSRSPTTTRSPVC